jgi:hypothetical protein
MIEETGGNWDWELGRRLVMVLRNQMNKRNLNQNEGKEIEASW